MVRRRNQNKEIIGSVFKSLLPELLFFREKLFKYKYGVKGTVVFELRAGVFELRGERTILFKM